MGTESFTVSFVIYVQTSQEVPKNDNYVGIREMMN